MNTVWGGATDLAQIRPTYGSSEKMGCHERIPMYVVNKR